MRAVLASIVLAALLAGCGAGGSHKSEAVLTPQEEAQAAAVAGVEVMDTSTRCERTLTTRLVVRIYGSPGRCRVIFENAAGQPGFGEKILASTVTGRRATVRLALGNGAGNDVAGTVTLRYDDATGWRIDDFDSDYLRSSLPADVGAQLGVVEPVLESDTSACIARSYRGAPAQQVKRLAYGVQGHRRSALLAVNRQLAKCTAAGVSVLRRILESDLSEELQGDTDGPAADELACILRGVRLTTSDELAAELLAGGGVSGREAERRLYPSVLRAAVACDAPRPAPLTDAAPAPQTH